MHLTVTVFFFVNVAVFHQRVFSVSLVTPEIPRPKVPII